MDRQQLRERYPQLANLSHPLEFPMLFQRWRQQLQFQAEKYGPGWQGSRWRTLHRRLLTDHASFPLQWLLLFSSLGTAGVSLLRRSSLDGHVVVAAYFVANYLLLVSFAPMDWDRYYLPTVISVQLLTALEVGHWIEAARGWLRRLRQDGATAVT